MKSIGMIIPTTDNSFFASLAAYVEKTLSSLRYSLLLASSANNAEKEKACFLQLIESGAEGILCVSGLSALPDDLLPADYPLVWVDRKPESTGTIPWVANDDAEAMEEAAEFLLEKGCRNILLLPGFLAEHQESPRVSGYRRALEKHGIEFDERYILNRAGVKSTEFETEEMIRSIMDQGIPIDGIITSSDRSAFGAMAALRSVGLYVPEDIKLISFDNSPYSAMATPGITALDRNPDVLAEKACEALLGKLKGIQPEKDKIIVPVSLVRRDSTR